MKEVKLGDVAKIITGKLDANAASENGKYPFFTCSRDILRIDNYAYDCECVLVAGNGDLNVKYYKGKFNAYQRTYIIEIKEGVEYSTIFVYWYLQLYIDTLRKNSVGSTIKYIKIGDLTGIALPLISLPEQERIVALLDKQYEYIDMLKNNAEHQLKAAKDLFQSALKEMLTPEEGWEKIQIRSCASVQNGYAFDSKLFNNRKDGRPLIRIRDIKRSYSDTYTTEICDKDFEVCNGDLLIGMDGDFNVSIWNGGDALLNQRVCKVIPRTIDLQFLYYYLPFPLKEINDKTPFATVKHLSSKQVLDISIPVPSLHEQQRIAAKLDALSERVKQLQSNYEQTITLCNDLKQSLLKSIFA